MLALNLTKTSNRSYEDVAIQTDKENRENKMVQTEDECDGMSLNSDTVLLNDVNFGTNVFTDLLHNTYQTDNLNAKRRFHSDMLNSVTLNPNGNLPIHEGVIRNDLNLVLRQCFALKARKLTVNMENHNGCTSLQLSIIHNSCQEIVQILLDFGANLGEIDGDGNNILHLAVKFESRVILETILTHSTFVIHRHTIDDFNFEGLTPLMLCAINKWTEGAQLLLMHKAEVNLKDQTSGRTALFHAAEAHCVKIVRILLDYRADPKIKNFFGTSPHDAMYELEDMPEDIKGLIFGRSKKRTFEPEMNPVRTAKAVKNLTSYQKLIPIESARQLSGTGPPRYKIQRFIK